ncbi:hypothetical protein PRIPAC_92932, partial [Pristionchus pacificus]|uniref:Uncharacterized protein n=1 Tax=Pristionchus pacificus TaxID=54126 RepID=A0A2A6BIE3_PRIPA
MLSLAIARDFFSRSTALHITLLAIHFLMGPTTFTLSTLPQDIIRRVIRMNSAWSIHKLRFSWNTVVSEFLRDRPPVEWLCMTETHYTLEVVVEAQRNHFRHFAINMIFHWKLVKIENSTAVIKFDIDLNDSWLMRWLFRLFMSTNHVKLLELRDLEEETLDIVDKAMQHVRIDQLDMRQDWMDQYLLKYIRRIVRRHRIIDVGLVAEYFNGRELCNYLVSLPRFTRFLYVKISEGLPKKPKAARRFWNAFAQCLIEKKGKSSVAILSGDHVMCFRV